jgi:hypothetical protein
MRFSLRTLIYAILSLPAFLVIHGAATVFVFGVAFATGEQGASSTGAMGIVCLILAPLFILADFLPLSDSAAVPVCVFGSSLFWWFVLVSFIWANIEAPVQQSTDQENSSPPQDRVPSDDKPQD